jgi:hypothetical protein
MVKYLQRFVIKFTLGDEKVIDNQIKKWVEENGSLVFVKDYFNHYEYIIDLIKFKKSGKQFEEFLTTVPLHLPDLIEDSIRYRYVCCVELFKSVSNNICDDYFNGSYSKMNKYFKNKLKKEIDAKKVKGIKQLRNTVSHSTDDLFTNLFQIKDSSIIENITTIGIYLIYYTDYLKIKEII